MVASSPKETATREEIQLKSVGAEKFSIAQDLNEGKDFLDAVSGRDTTNRDSEKIRAEHAAQLGGVDLERSAKGEYVDSRVAAKTGVAARATSDENSFSATKAILDADLGVSSSVDSSLRSSAQSKTQLQSALASAEQTRQNSRLDATGTVVGGLGSAYANGAFDVVDPLANPNQVRPDLNDAVLTDPNRRDVPRLGDPSRMYFYEELT